MVNVLTGRYRNREVVAFEYQYTVYRQGVYRFSVVVIRLPTGLPQLVVSEAGTDLLGGLLEMPAIEGESERFNTEFRVRSREERYAHAVMHPRVMEMLLDRGDVPWRIDGADLIGWGEGPLEAGDVLARIEALSEVAEPIPPFVFTDYGQQHRLS